LRDAHDDVGERRKALGEIALDMHAQGAPPALGKHAEIAARLGRLDDAEARRLTRYG